MDDVKKILENKEVNLLSVEISDYLKGKIDDDDRMYVNEMVEDIVKKLTLTDVVKQSEQLPTTCVIDMPDSKYCDCSGECKWCENIRR